jgi:tetratricopeptide (TPR) repeat protein
MGSFWRQVRSWERPAQWALALAFGLLGLDILAIIAGPTNWRQPALIGLFGLVVMIQLIFMWANRGMLTTFGKAQRHYLNEDFAEACHLLETERAVGRANARSLTLLGNAYRQRGLLSESEAALREALALQPNAYFPLYGFGRTLLIQGQYAEAAQALEAAWQQGAPAAVRVDAAEAYYRSGDASQAQAHLEAVMPAVTEPQRVLMGRYLLYRLTPAAAPMPAEIEAGLPYWQAHAERFRHTPYGQSLAEDVQVLQTLIKETK